MPPCTCRAELDREAEREERTSNRQGAMYRTSNKQEVYVHAVVEFHRGDAASHALLRSRSKVGVTSAIFANERMERLYLSSITPSSRQPFGG